MVDQLTATEGVTAPDVSHLMTEDDTPVDNWASEKQQRLLTSCLYSNLQARQPFVAAANVGIYHTVSEPAIVPDVFVSFGVSVPENWWQKQHRCYLMWNFGKPPEIALEIVSNKIGGELTEKLQTYEQMRVGYYAVYDPNGQLGDRPLRLFELQGLHYAELAGGWLPQVDLGLTLWQGELEGRQDTWLRWCDAEGRVLPTGDEQAAQERQRAEQERQRADRLAALLRAQGIDPEQLPE